MAKPTLSEAAAEAYAVAKTDVIAYSTIEIRHPAFVDEDGNPTAIRAVRSHEDLHATLEADAPVNAGETVRWVAMAFDFTLPAVKAGEQSHLQLTVDAHPEIVRRLEAAVEEGSPIDLTYREYLSDDLSAPELDPPLHMTLTNVTATKLAITGRAGFSDLKNRRFGKLYTPDDFRALVS